MLLGSIFFHKLDLFWKVCSSRSGLPLHFFINNRNFEVLPKIFSNWKNYFHFLDHFVRLSHFSLYSIATYQYIYKQYICSLIGPLLYYVKFHVILTKLLNCLIFCGKLPKLFIFNVVYEKRMYLLEILSWVPPT